MFPGKKSCWLKLVDLVPNEELTDLLTSAVAACPTKEVLWLRAAKQQLKLGELASCQTLLTQAVENVPGSEEVRLALVKVAVFAGRFSEARKIIREALTVFNSGRVWMKAIQLEREVGNIDEAVSMSKEALDQHPTSWKIWAMLIQMTLDSGDSESACRIASEAIDKVGKNSIIWGIAADAYVAAGECAVARSLLERGRLRLPSSDYLWLKSVQLELEANRVDLATLMLSKAINACPTSGLLWAEAIKLEPVQTRHPKCLDALKKCPESGLVVAEVATFFWKVKHQTDKAKKWFENAIKLEPSNGDIWAAAIACEVEQGDVDLVRSLIQKYVSAEPNRGLLWNRVVKRVENWRKDWVAKMRVVLDEEYSKESSLIDSSIALSEIFNS